MPGLASIADEFGDRVGFLTVLIDMEPYRERAINIVESVNAQFLTIDVNENVYQSLVPHFTSGYIPETVLFDGDGNVLANIVGGSAEEYRNAIENALNG